MPGINAPGDYLRDYAPNPGKVALDVLRKANDGTYEHYFPARPKSTTSSSPVTAPQAQASATPKGRQ